MDAFRITLRSLYVIGFAVIAIAATVGYPYYALPLVERPHSNMHELFKPAGIWGHGLGVIGSAFVLLLLLYSARKRQLWGLRAGRLSRWLDVHIFLGVMGPLLITLHTALKFGGIVSISYFSMVIVALSGVFGRYIYMQIPRDSRGHKLSLEDATRRLTELRESLRSIKGVAPDLLDAITHHVSESTARQRSRSRPILGTIAGDLAMPFRMQRVRRLLKRANVAPSTKHEIIQLVRAQTLLRRRISLHDTIAHVFHMWHVFHKPFAYIMIVIMFVHIGVVVLFGYKWVF